MNTMKFYRTRRIPGGARELVTLRVKITQSIAHWRDSWGYAHKHVTGKTRADACALARTGGFYRTKREALRA